MLLASKLANAGSPMSAASLMSLDLSKSKLSTGLPGLEALRSLTECDLSCNRFKALPPELSGLSRLAVLNASRNFLKPKPGSLLLPASSNGGSHGDLRSLHNLRELDLRFNERLGHPDFAAWIAQALGKQIVVRLTSWGNAAAGARPSDRDATSLRAQLEPWPTPVLRRRLRDDFGDTVKWPHGVPRPEASVLYTSRT